MSRYRLWMQVTSLGSGTRYEMGTPVCEGDYEILIAFARSLGASKISALPIS